MVVKYITFFLSILYYKKHATLYGSTQQQELDLALSKHRS